MEGTPLWLSQIATNRDLLIEVAVSCNCIPIYPNLKVIVTENRVDPRSTRRVALLTCVSF